MEEYEEARPNRPHRPESRTSSSRLTPQSSNGSSANLPNRTNNSIRDTKRMTERVETERRDPSGASLLQERLKEKKAARLSEQRRSADVDTMLDESVAQSSPRNRAANRPTRDREVTPSTMGERTGGKKGMGIKEMEDTVSTLHKQNFDLKLELFHRRERQTLLEERLEAAEARIAEHAEMQAINDQLLAELEKRDQAVEEAVGIICALEEKIDKLSEERDIVRSFVAEDESSYFYSKDVSGVRNRRESSSPVSQNKGRADLKPKQIAGTSKPLVRMPSFLSDQGEGSQALRSFYLPSDQQSQSILSLPKLAEDTGSKHEHEDADVDGMNSPRLSVLSESSFLSVYGEKSLALEGLNLNDGPDSLSPERRHRKSLSIEKWVDERVHATSPLGGRSSVSKGPTLRNGQFPSITNILESPLQRLEKLERTLKHHQKRHISERVSGIVRKGGDAMIEEDTTRRTEMTTFERQQTLPPTPDTISTNTLRRYKTSNETLCHVIDGAEQVQGRTYMDGAPFSSSYGTLLMGRPHSAGETITSRREGHGWDTVTQSEVTETNSEVDAEISSAFDPWLAMGQEKPRPRVQPPDMFNFADAGDDDWGRDMMFNRDGADHLPQMKRQEYSGRRVEDPRSDDTITNSPRVGRSRAMYDSSLPAIPPPSLGNQSPNPPVRRSSLAHSPSGYEKKPRNPSSQPSDPSPPFPTTTRQAPAPASASHTLQSQKDSKRARLTSRLFSLGRSDATSISMSSSAPSKQPSKPADAAPTATASFPRSQSYTTDHHFSTVRAKRATSVDLSAGAPSAVGGSSATPPPIPRYPRTRDGGGGRERETSRIPRPLTASSLESKFLSRDVGGLARPGGGFRGEFGGDGAGSEGDVMEMSGGGGNGRESANANGNGGEGGKGGGIGRKWFGLGRSMSLRR